MERRLLLVFALTFLVIMLFQPLLKKYMPQPPANQQSAQPVPAPNQTQGAVAQPAGSTPQVSGSRASTKNASPVGKQASTESETVIENDLYRIVFTNRGGRVKSWVLKKWDDEKGNPLDLVNNAAAEKYGYPLSLWTFDENLRNKLDSALYVATSTSSTAPAQITFEYADADVSVHKTLNFDHTYVVGVQ